MSDTTKFKSMNKVTQFRRYSFAISTGQDGMLADTTVHKLCNAELPCIGNGTMVSDVEDYDRMLASEITIVCYSGYAFPDGAFIKEIHCERVVDEKGRVIMQWQKLGGGCKRKSSFVCHSINLLHFIRGVYFMERVSKRTKHTRNTSDVIGLALNNVPFCT